MYVGALNRGPAVAGLSTSSSGPITTFPSLGASANTFSNPPSVLVRSQVPNSSSNPFAVPAATPSHSSVPSGIATPSPQPLYANHSMCGMNGRSNSSGPLPVGTPPMQPFHASPSMSGLHSRSNSTGPLPVGTPPTMSQPPPPSLIRVHSPQMSGHGGYPTVTAPGSNSAGPVWTAGMGNSTPVASGMGGAGSTYMAAREQMLERKIRELETLLEQRNMEIRDLNARLASKENNSNHRDLRSSDRGGGGMRMRKNASAPSSPQQAPRRSSNRPRYPDELRPMVPYTAMDPDDPIDIRLEEFYNSTASAIPFRRINRGFYRFGETIVELKIINHKLMAATEDGWNRGKFGPIERFMMHYEGIEREQAGLLDE